MCNLSPNAQKLYECIILLLSQKCEKLTKEKLKNKPYNFSDQSIYELIRNSIIEEDEETIWLVKKGC